MACTNAGNTFACYGCMDFVNNERTMAYHRWACLNGLYPEGCNPTIDLCYCPDDSPEVPFVDPITDNVCWYDTAAPESAQFLGAFILGVNGKYDSTFSREVADGFIEGSLLQRARLKGRAMGFDIVLLATSEEGMAYGVEWLRRVLEDNLCTGVNPCSSCAGQAFTLRKHCPMSEDILDDGLHVWLSTGLVDGLVEVKRTPTNGAYNGCYSTLRQFTFSVQAESPYSYSVEPTTTCIGDASDEDAYVRCYDWTSDCIECVDSSCCDKCGFDQLCQCYPSVDIVPTLLIDDCYCEPLAKIIQCCCTPDISDGYDSAFVIQIYSGTNFADDDYKRFGLRDFRLKIYQNPKGLPCITDDDSYDDWCNLDDGCIDLKVSYIPENSTLSIDGRTGRITLDCNGTCRPFDHVVTSDDGSVFPLIMRCAPMMVCAQWSYYGTQTNPAIAGVIPASMQVDTYTRYRS